MTFQSRWSSGLEGLSVQGRVLTGFFIAIKTFLYPSRIFHMLDKLCLLVWVLMGITFQVDAQITKEYIVEEKEGFEQVKLDFSSYKGSSYIKGHRSGLPLRVHAHISKVNILPTFTHDISDGVLNASINHQNVESENLGRSLSNRLFSGDKGRFDHSWFIDLNREFTYELDLNLGLGKSEIDLSHIAVSKFKISTASADVSLGYSSNTLNTATMDTMAVAINMGTLEGKKMNYSNAKNMFFDVNYGSVNLSFVDGIPGGSTISTMVGAGSINIDLPSENLPYIIKVTSTPLCRTSVPKYLKEIGNKTYVSKGYNKNAKNLMTFLVDISVGSVSLK